MAEHKILIEHLFRRKYGKILAVLLHHFGYEYFDVAEEAVQTAFQKALENWSVTGTPDNPAGWLSTVAKNAAYDAIKREKIGRQKVDQLKNEIEESFKKIAQPEVDPGKLNNEMDDLAVMILLCCNPEVSEKAQVCLTLKTACGFSVREISRALAMNEESVKKTITRAKEKIAVSLELLKELKQNKIVERFKVVMEILYAMFTEGYSASSGEMQLRKEIAEEAIYLSNVLLGSKLISEESKPELYALIALMYFQFARFEARIKNGGIPTRLQEQDRNLWDWSLISAGFAMLEKSKQTDTISSYHLEARIAAEHSASNSFDETNWKSIYDLYRKLLQIKDTFHVRLNSIVALKYAESSEAALNEIEKLSLDRKIPDGRSGEAYLYHSVKADILEALKNKEAAKEWEKALKYAPTLAEQKFIKEKIKNIF